MNGEECGCGIDEGEDCWVDCGREVYVEQKCSVFI